MSFNNTLLTHWILKIFFTNTHRTHHEQTFLMGAHNITLESWFSVSPIHSYFLLFSKKVYINMIMYIQYFFFTLFCICILSWCININMFHKRTCIRYTYIYIWNIWNSSYIYRYKMYHHTMRYICTYIYNN